MSERIDWIPVTAWSAWVAFQASSALYEWWTKPRNVRNEIEEQRNRVEKKLRASEYGKILRGEKINGWKSCKFDSISDLPSRPYYQLLPPLWPKEGVDDTPVDTSVLVVMEPERSPNGNTELIFIIRRYSLVAPGLYDDIVQIFFDYARDRWWPMMQSYVNESIVALVWQRLESKEMRIILINIDTKTYQFLETTSPSQHAELCAIFNCSDDDHLMILFNVWVDHICSCHLVEYEISPSESIRSPIVHQVASRRLDWRQGNWRLSSKIHDGLSFPGAFYRMEEDDTGEKSVVSLDRHGFHDLGPAAEWIAKFKTSPVGQRMAAAKNSLTGLVPIGSSSDFELHRSHLFGRVDFTSHAHQPLSSPTSLMHRSAEVLCMAKPNFDFDDLKSKIGFDIFDGICDGKAPIVIRM